jgi:glycolate oxidase
MRDEVIQQLITLLGESKVEQTGNVVVSPSGITDLQKLLSWATQHEMPVGVYRRRPRDRVRIDFAKMDSILDIDRANLVAMVEPGVTLKKLQEELGQFNLRFVPGDSPFHQDKTVGQMFYEGHSNILGLKYGSAKHYLMGSTLVLPTGEVFQTGGKTVKNVTGYDFTRFFNAPFCGLAVAGAYLLKLLPVPEARKRSLIRFDSFAKVMAFADGLKRMNLTPAYLIWADAYTMGTSSGISQEGHTLLVEVEGLCEEVAEQWKIVAKVWLAQQGRIIEETEAAEVVSLQRLYLAESDLSILDEFRLRYSTQRELVPEIYSLAQERNIRLGLFGQISEGIIHLLTHGDDSQKLPEFIDCLTCNVHKQGGYVTGRYARLHGHVPESPLYHLELTLKNALDPKLVINRERCQA